MLVVSRAWVGCVCMCVCVCVFVVYCFVFLIVTTDLSPSISTLSKSIPCQKDRFLRMTSARRDVTLVQTPGKIPR